MDSEQAFEKLVRYALDTYGVEIGEEVVRSLLAGKFHDSTIGDGHLYTLFRRFLATDPDMRPVEGGSPAL